MPWPYKLEKLYRFLRLPFSVQWRAYLVRLPWLVPLLALRITSPEEPFPSVIQLPSRRGGHHKIPVHVFVPIISSGGGSGGDDDDDDSSAGPAGGWPVHIDFHGGGFIMGSCLEQAPWCALVARRTGRVVLSVDYRKGPVDAFPAAVKDAEDVLAAVLDAEEEQKTAAGKLLCRAVLKAAAAAEARRSRRGLLGGRTGGGSEPVLNANDISLSGFSSGGNLALNLLLSVEAAGSGPWSSLFPADGPPIPTLLFYPSFDSRQLPHERRRPAKMLKADSSGGGGGGSSSSSSSWFSSISSVLGPTYLSAEQRVHPRASPGLNSMSRSLCRRARIRLVLPEMDTLAQQSEDWVGRMLHDGLDYMLLVAREPDMLHGWTQFPDAWLSENARRRKYAVFADSVEFIKNRGSKWVGAT